MGHPPPPADWRPPLLTTVAAVILAIGAVPVVLFLWERRVTAAGTLALSGYAGLLVAVAWRLPYRVRAAAISLAFLALLASSSLSPAPTLNTFVIALAAVLFPRVFLGARAMTACGAAVVASLLVRWLQFEGLPSVAPRPNVSGAFIFAAGLGGMALALLHVISRLEALNRRSRSLVDDVERESAWHRALVRTGEAIEDTERQRWADDLTRTLESGLRDLGAAVDRAAASSDPRTVGLELAPARATVDRLVDQVRRVAERVRAAPTGETVAATLSPADVRAGPPEGPADARGGGLDAAWRGAAIAVAARWLCVAAVLLCAITLARGPSPAEIRRLPMAVATIGLLIPAAMGGRPRPLSIAAVIVTPLVLGGTHLVSGHVPMGGAMLVVAVLLAAVGATRGFAVLAYGVALAAVAAGAFGVTAPATVSPPPLTVALFWVGSLFAAIVLAGVMAAVHRAMHSLEAADEAARHLLARLTGEVARRQAAARRLERVAASERRRIGAELRSGIIRHLDELREALRSAGRQAGRHGVAGSLAVARDRLEAIRRRATSLSSDLRPAAPSILGGLSAVCWLVEETCARAGLVADVRVEVDAPKVPRHVEKTVYRVVQAGLANTLRHARATRVSLAIVSRPDGLGVTLADDGVGFDARAVLAEADTRGAVGLPAIRDRLAALGSTLAVESALGRGASLSFVLAEVA